MLINSRLPINGMKMPRPQQIRPRPPLTDDQIKAASYVGSAEHKVKRWWGGLPFGWESGTGKATRPKKLHTTICRKVSSADKEEASSWVRAALEAGQFRYFEGDKTYPKHLWGCIPLAYVIDSSPRSGQALHIRGANDRRHRFPIPSPRRRNVDWEALRCRAGKGGSSLRRIRRSQSL